MSPLLELEPAYESFSADPKNIRKFFDGKIEPNEAWEWHVPVQNKVDLFASMGVKFTEPLDSYWKKDESGATFYKVFSTFEAGVFLKVSAKDADHLDSPQSIMANVRDYTFVRYGEARNEEYLGSLMNG